MYINDKPPIYSFRTAQYNGKEILLIGGSDHKTGEPVPDNSKYEELEKKAKELYPDCKVLFRWNTRDCISLDKIPYIGEFSNLMKNIYIGTGFKKWGITFSNISVIMRIQRNNLYGQTTNPRHRRCLYGKSPFCNH